MMFAEKTWKRRLLDLTLQAFALLVVFGVPSLVTALSPVSRVKFSRSADGEHVMARAQKCLMFVIPFKTVVVDPVESFGENFVGGRTIVRRRSGTDHKTETEDQSFLVIKGRNQVAEIPVSSTNLDAVRKRVEAYLQNPQEPELKLFVVANWKFSVFAGGLATLMPVIFLGCCVYGLGQKFRRRSGRGRAGIR